MESFKILKARESKSKSKSSNYSYPCTFTVEFNKVEAHKP